MAYQFNPHRHVKIWLSKDKNTFLNLENQVRLVKMRDINPNDEIYFIYDSRLLSPQALEALNTFSTRYKIIAKDIRTKVIPNCQSEAEKKLIDIYEDEISHLYEEGNLAVGSDILRWLKPVYELGTYTDFDVNIDTRKLPKTIAVEKPLLMSVGSSTLKGDVEAVSMNNDIIGVVDSQAALPYIQKIQKTIYSAYARQLAYSDNFIEKFVSASKNTLNNFFQPFFVDLLLKLDSNASMLSILAKLSKGKTARELRKEMIEVTANNVNFGKNILFQNLNFFDDLSDTQIITHAARLQRSTLKQQLGWGPWFLMSKSQYHNIKMLAAIKDDNELLTHVRENLRMAILKNSVMYSSGPGALLYALFEKLFYKKDVINKEIALFSFANYGLDKAFISENRLSFHASPKAAALVQKSEIGTSNDMSWLEEGQRAVAMREQKIIQAQAHMPQDFYDMRMKIEDHIEKIQADLKGCFGFYRYRERHAKIDALKHIIKHFEGSLFDVGGFNAALERYRIKDVSASIGKSKTKDLIEELALFGQRAKHYMLTNENGRVEVLPPTRNHL